MSLKEKFEFFTKKTYPEQAQCYLNAYWFDKGGQDAAEDIWNYTNKFIELDQAKGEEGSDLDEFNAHRFLESLNETKTVKEMRQALSQADLDFNKRLALIEYCLWRYNHTIEDFVKKPQGDSDEIKKFEEMLKAVQNALDEAQSKAEAAKEALKVSKQKEQESQKEAAEAKKAADELKAALAELQAQEDAYNNKKAELEKKSQTGGVVSRNKAANELAQLLAEDPLPLRQAKITQEAATKRAEKTKEAAEEAAKRAGEARVNAEKAVEDANTAVDEANQEVAKTEEALEEAKKHAKAHGNIWWVERKLAEAKKYMPKKKGGTW